VVGAAPISAVRRASSLFSSKEVRITVPPFALEGRQDLVRRHLADQQEQDGIARLQVLRRILHEPIVDADIGERAAERRD